MAWTVPPSYTSSQIITQTDLHVGLRDNMRELWHEIAYVEFTGDVTVTGGVHTEAAPIDIVSSGALTYIANPIMIEFHCPNIIFSSATAIIGLALWDGATDLGRMALMGNTVNYLYGPPARRLTPTAASHTYKVRAFSAAGNGTVKAGAGGVATYLPGYIRVLQRGS